MSQYIPNTATSRLTPINSTIGNAAHGARPQAREHHPAARPKNRTRPERWPETSASRPAVTTPAPSVAPITWPIALPPAGGVLPASAAAGTAATKTSGTASTAPTPTRPTKQDLTRGFLPHRSPLNRGTTQQPGPASNENRHSFDPPRERPPEPRSNWPPDPGLVHVSRLGR